MTDPEAALATQLRNIEQSTGRTVGQWADLVAAAGLAKHGQIVSFLKAERGLTHGNGNTLAHRIRERHGDGVASDADATDLTDAVDDAVAGLWSRAGRWCSAT